MIAYFGWWFFLYDFGKRRSATNDITQRKTRTHIWALDFLFCVSFSSLLLAGVIALFEVSLMACIVFLFFSLKLYTLIGHAADYLLWLLFFWLRWLLFFWSAAEDFAFFSLCFYFSTSGSGYILQT